MNDPLPSETRVLWMAWTDQNGGWLASIHGSSQFETYIQQRIDRETEEYGSNRFDLRPVRVTVHL
jgi:hypothetical protein